MTSGELERLSVPVESVFRNLEIRIMDDMVRRIKINGFSTASADWQISRLQQLGMSEAEIKEWTRMALDTSEEEVEKLFSEEIYHQYMGYDKAYRINGMKQIPFEENLQLQSLIKAIKYQTIDAFRNITNSMGFVKLDRAGHIYGIPLTEFYQDTLDAAVLDIHSGAFSYQAVLRRTIEDMTKSGIRWIDYKSGRHNRIDVAARRAVMTGFRQVQGEINEQVARDLGTDSFEVTYHIGARPSHQLWQGKVWTRQQLVDVCGLGSVTGLHGANCYHDYNAFIPGVSVRTYSDEQLEQMMVKENTPKNYLGKEYTAYEALQKQRQMETAMRKTRRDIRLLQEGEADKDAVTVKRCRYQVQMQQYKAFSNAMGLPEQMQRVYQDGLGRVAAASEKKQLARMKISIPDDVYGKSKMTKKVKSKIEGAIRKLEDEYNIYLDGIEGEYINSRDIFLTGGYVDKEGILRHNLVINYKKDFTKLEKRMLTLYNDGEMAGKCYEDYIAHEMAHIIPFQNCTTEKEYLELSKVLESEFIAGISGYADRKKDGRESLAEAFVKYRNGEEIPEAAQKLIKKYIEPWRR